ncbi:hypothetical protein [Paenibacillus sp. Z6-24]
MRPSSRNPPKCSRSGIVICDDLLALGMTPTGIADNNKPEAMNKLAGKLIEYMPWGEREIPDPDIISTVAPDLIFIATDDSGAITNEWKKLPVWNNLKAVKSNHVYMVDRNIRARFRGIIPAEKIGQNALDLINSKVTFK